MLLISVSDLNFKTDWLIPGSCVDEWHGLNTRSRVYQMSEGSGTSLTKFFKSLWRFSGKKHSTNLKLANFIWVFVVDEFDEWLTLSPWDWASRVRFSSNSSTTHFYFYLFLDVVYIYFLLLLSNVVSFRIWLLIKLSKC